MKEPKRIPLTDNPRKEEPQRLPLKPLSNYDIEMVDDIWIKKEDENNTENNKTSIQQLESYETD